MHVIVHWEDVFKMCKRCMSWWIDEPAKAGPMFHSQDGVHISPYPSEAPHTHPGFSRETEQCPIGQRFECRKQAALARNYCNSFDAAVGLLEAFLTCFHQVFKSVLEGCPVTAVLYFCDLLITTFTWFILKKEMMNDNLHQLLEICSFCCP